MYFRVLAYDCEVGISTVDTDLVHMTYTTSGDTYQMDICMSLESKEDKKEMCGSYLFRMPYVNEIDGESEWNDLVLIEKDQLFNAKKIVLHFPFNYQGPRNVALIQLSSSPAKGSEGDITRTLIKHFSANDDVSTASFDMIEYIEAGFQYEVVLVQDAETLEKETNKLNSSRIITVATFSIEQNETANRRATIAIVVILLLIVVIVVAIIGYIQYLRVKKHHKVEPKR